MWTSIYSVVSGSGEGRNRAADETTPINADERIAVLYIPGDAADENCRRLALALHTVGIYRDQLVFQ
jgi:hypothetical protein